MSDTGTKPIEQQSFNSRIKAADEETLRAIGSDEFGVNFDTTLNKKTMETILLDMYKHVKAEAKLMNKQSAQLFLDRDKDEPIIQVKFLPQEFANAPLEFCYDGKYGVDGKGGTKVKPGQKKRLKKMPRFKLVAGESYKLPIVVVEHLQSLVTRDNKAKIDPESGMVIGNMPVIRSRFLVPPDISSDRMKELQTTL
jgi:hypothetical protein